MKMVTMMEKMHLVAVAVAADYSIKLRLVAR